MCEAVKRNNAGILGGQFFDVTDELINEVKGLSPKLAKKPETHIAKTILNGVFLGVLASPSKDGRDSISKFHIPGGKSVNLPIVIIAGNPNPKLLFDEKRRTKVT